VTFAANRGYIFYISNSRELIYYNLCKSNYITVNKIEYLVKNHFLILGVVSLSYFLTYLIVLLF
jgi:hypothetical protein